MFNLGGHEILIVLLLVLLLFGAKKLPELARSFGEGIREFRRTVRDVDASIPEERKG